MSQRIRYDIAPIKTMTVERYLIILISLTQDLSAQDDAALHWLLHEVCGEGGQGGVHDERHQEHEDGEAGDGDQREGEGGVELDLLLHSPGWCLFLLLFTESLLLHYCQHLCLGHLTKHGWRHLITGRSQSRSWLKILFILLFVIHLI